MSLIGPEGRKQLKLAARFASAGLELAASIVLGYFGGRAADRWLGTAPYLGYAGLLLGIAAGFRSLFRLARTAQDAADRGQDPPNSPPPSDRER
jgi:F0F1-type ATP synthase assembly protein I